MRCSTEEYNSMPFIQFQFRRGTASEWSSNNPLLAVGEIGIETNTNKLKIGDGSLLWNALPYGGIMGPTGPAGDASTVTGPTGPQGIQGNAGPTGPLGASNLGNIVFNDTTISTTGTNSYIEVTGNLIPSGNVTYDLGSSTYNWRHLYVGSNTVYIGGTPVTVANGSLTVSGNAIISSDRVVATAIVIVDTQGNDVTGNGSIGAPFATIQKAHDWLVNNVASSVNAVITVNPGDYGEDLTLTRPKTSITGPTHFNSRAVRLSGAITVNSTTALDGVFNDVFTIQNMVISSNQSTLLTLGGTAAYTMHLQDVQLFSDEATTTLISCTNNVSGGIKLNLYTCNLLNQGSSTTSVVMNNCRYGDFRQTRIFGGTGAVLTITTSNIVLESCNIQNGASGNVIVVNSAIGTQFNPITAPTGSIALTAGNTTFIGGSSSGNGINIAAGATAYLGQNAFSITNGSGFAIRGVSGSFVIHANNIITPGSNVKLSTAIGAGIIPMTTSFTLT